MSGPANTLRSKVLTCAAVVVIGAGLHLGRALFVPLAFAILLCLILTPLVRGAERLRLPRPLSAIAVVLMIFGLLGFAGYFVAGQAANLAEGLPEYRSNALAKLNAIRVPLEKTVNRIQEAFRQAESATAPKTPPKPGEDKDPVKVAVVESPLSPIKVATVVGGVIFDAVGSVALVMLLVIFFLIYRAEIRDRVIRLAGDAQVSLTNQTITDTARGLSRFLSLQAILNVAYGTVFGLVMFAFGVPGALLWGVLAALLRFVPYVGPVTAAALPILLSLGVFPGWTRSLMVAGAIVVLELIQNNVIETVVYGKRAGLSPLAVVLAAIFWTWVWGGPGLLLSIPLTLCLVTVGKHVPSLQFLAVALGDEPALDSKLQVYHRLLGRHPGQAAEYLEKELKESGSLADLCDTVILPVVRIAENDIRQDKLDEAKAFSIFTMLREIVDDLAETVRTDSEKRGVPPPAAKRLSVHCLPAGGPGDELSAHLLAQVLSLDGYGGGTTRPDDLDGPANGRNGNDLVVLCVVPPSNLLRIRNLYRKIRRKFGEVPILHGVWGNGDPASGNGRAGGGDRSEVVTSFIEAEKKIAQLDRTGTPPS
jgi:predicted PurR-regulated permease PerM